MPFDSHRVGLFIGVNVPGALRQLDMRVPTIDTHPSAVRTPFGWTVMGPMDLPGLQDEALIQEIVADSTATLSLTKWLNHKFASTKERNQFNISQEKDAFNILIQIKLVSGHYVLPLLWKSANSNLPDNRSSVLYCFFVNEARCKRDPLYSERTTRGMEMYIVTSGFARQLLPEELKSPPGRTWYLPFFSNISIPVEEYRNTSFTSYSSTTDFIDEKLYRSHLSIFVTCRLELGGITSWTLLAISTITIYMH